MPPYRERSLSRSIAIDLESAEPLYKQIADGVRALIARGALAEGEEVPSVRQLGGMLGVNLNTVAKAYRMLADERVISLEQGKAAKVLAARAMARPIDAEARRELAALVGRLRVRGASEAEVREVFEEALRRFYEGGGAGS